MDVILSLPILIGLIVVALAFDFLSADGKRATAVTLPRRSRAKSLEYSLMPHAPIQMHPFRKSYPHVAQRFEYCVTCQFVNSIWPLSKAFCMARFHSMNFMACHPQAFQLIPPNASSFPCD